MKNILKFTLLSFALTWAAAAIFRLCGGAYNTVWGTLLGSICMLIPTLSTVIMQALNGEPVLKGIGISFKVNRWWFVGWLLMPAASVLMLTICAILPGMKFSTGTEIITTALSQMEAGGLSTGPGGLFGIGMASGLLAGCTINAVFALGEEAGWRGYLLRQFEGRSFLFTCLVIGTIWGLWHAPIILMGHNFPDHPVAGVFMMVLFCIVLTPVITFIRIKAKSVIAAAIAHGTLNATCGLAVMYTENYNDLLGVAGAAGIVTFLLIDIALFLVDRYARGGKIFTL